MVVFIFFFCFCVVIGKLPAVTLEYQVDGMISQCYCRESEPNHWTSLNQFEPLNQFSALTLLVKRQEEHPSCKKILQQFPTVICWRPVKGNRKSVSRLDHWDGVSDMRGYWQSSDAISRQGKWLTYAEGVREAESGEPNERITIGEYALLYGV